jgi:hypothetical protein
VQAGAFPFISVSQNVFSTSSRSPHSMSDTAQAPPPPAAETSGSPAEFLKNVVGKEVKVRIGQGIDYQGTFAALLPLMRADGWTNQATCRVWMDT